MQNISVFIEPKKYFQIDLYKNKLTNIAEFIRLQN